MKKNTITLAVVDDCILQRNFLKLIAGGVGGFEILVEAENGRDFLDKLQTLDKLPSVCILDLDMPVMNGVELASKLTVNYPSMLLFGYTGTDSSDEIDAMLKNGVIEVLKKNSALELFNSIKRFYAFSPRDLGI